MSQRPGALRVCVNCFLPGALGREPRSLSRHLLQYKQMPKHFKYAEEEKISLGLAEEGGGEGEMESGVK